MELPRQRQESQILSSMDSREEQMCPIRSNKQIMILLKDQNTSLESPLSLSVFCSYDTRYWYI